MQEGQQSLKSLQDSIRSFSDPREREIAEASMLPGGTATVNSERKHILVFLHGMNTYADWQEMLSEPIRNLTNLTPLPLGYGNVHPIKFLLPFPYRQSRLKIVHRELNALREDNAEADISIVAHSFGTHLLTKTLLKSPSLKLKHVILCGSIIDSDFNWNALKTQFCSPIVNDIGMRDPWPSLAKGWSLGYGDSGSFGFKKGRTIDRFFDLDHSGFLNYDHAKEFWLPLLVDGRVVPSPANTGIRKLSCWQSEVRRFTLFHLTLILLLASFSWYWWA